MWMRSLRIALAFSFSTGLFAQGCVTFAGAQIAPYNGSAVTGLVQQPNGSYTAVIGTISPPYQILNVVPNFDQWIGSCASPPVALTFPSVSMSSTAAGTASQVAAFGNFNGPPLPGAAITAAASPLPMVKVGVETGGVVSLTNYAVPDGAASVATADFNGDGKTDLAVVYTGAFSGTSQVPGGVAILLGNGDGTFKSAVTYPAGINALHEAVADFNGDGKLDIAVAADSGSVTVLLGNGDGTFSAGSTITAPLGQNPAAVIAADFNGDGKLDLATANENGTVSVLLGNGDGTFQAQQSFPAGADCAYLAAGDLNKDGKLDLVVTNFDGGLLAVLLGKGDGTFGSPTLYSAVSAPTGIVLTDFNHDGNLDIVVGSGSAGIIGPDLGSGDIAVLLGNGDGTFQGGPLYPVGSSPKSIVAGDLNGDGKPDLVVANQASNNLTILLNQGKGTFTAAAPYTLSSNGNLVGPNSVVLADFNGDGKLDAATANADEGNVAVALGTGSGTFQGANFFTTGTGAIMVAAGDLNGDGKPDLAVANEGNLTSDGTDSGSVSILLNSGGGAFKPATNITAGVQPAFVVLQDVNADGKLDLIVLNMGLPTGFSAAPSPGGISVMLGNGNGTFQTQANFAAGTNPTALAVGDLNGDGKPDLAVATTQSNGGSVVAVLLGNGDGTFQTPTYWPGQFGMTDIVISDLNLDGKPDLVMTSCCGDTQMSYLLGNGDGTFQPQVLFNGGPSPYFMTVADFNGDGKPDLAITDNGSGISGYVTVLLNSTQVSAFSTKSATAGQVEPFATQSIVAAYGANLATGTAVATGTLGTSLDGTTVTITDSAGTTAQALLFYVSATQVNYEIPAGLAAGAATVTIKNGSGVSQTATIQIGSVSPGLFALDSAGLVAALVLPVVSGTQQALQPVYQIVNGSVAPLPINVAAAATQIYLEMYGTGIRNATNVTVTVGGMKVPVLYSGAAPGYAGEDQVNIGPLPQSLAGAGSVNIVLSANGQPANTVNVTIQ
jgi:uncharacterized protein (TIGR03437 family)